MKLRALVAGVVGSFVVASAAHAADPIYLPPPAPPAPPMMPAPVAGFNWNGLYAGGQAFIVPGGGLFLYGGQVGFNLQRNNLVFGGEAGVVTSPGGGGIGYTAFGKIGLALGASHRILAYGTVGTIFAGGGGLGVLFGGGAALGIGENLSVFAEGLTVGGACCFIRAGANFHFGN